MAGAVLAMTTACSPDDYDLGAVTYKSEDLVESKAFSVTPDADNPNIIHLTSLVSGCTPVWDTPSGRSQSADWTISLPFAGDYTVTFGVITGAGTVWGAPYTFTVGQNDFGMLNDQIWTNIAGGVDENGVGNPKTWVPVDRSYGVGNCTCPIMYMNPDDVMNDGSGVTDIVFGGTNWSPNWDPGFVNWLILPTDPYMDSYMTFGLDADKGCTLEMFRGTESGGSAISGGFVLNIADASHPTITFTGGTYALHMESFDAVCDNYVNDIKILECTPYLLQLATMRTNDEGEWWIVWNYIAKDVQDGLVEIPAEGPDLLGNTEPVLPSYDNLEESLFTIVGDDATYVATAATYLFNDEVPYDYYWWNGSDGITAWQSMNLYGNSALAPAYGAAEDFSLTLTRETGAAVIETADNTINTTFTVSENTITFADEITLLTNDNGVAISGTEFTVLKCSPLDEELIIGVPAGTNNNGTVNKYLCVNLTPKSISGGTTGPTEIAVDNSLLNCYIEADDHYRIELYNPWSDKTWPIDISRIKLKKNQTMKITFSLSGITWKDDATPKALLANNIEGLGFSWPENGGGFENGVEVNKSGETTLTLTNTTGSTVTFEDSSCITICISCKNLAESPVDENGLLVPEQVTATINSFTIE